MNATDSQPQNDPKPAAEPMCFPTTLVEAVRQFSDLDHATAFFAHVRWPNGVVCPHCGSTRSFYIAERRVWECESSIPAGSSP